MSYYNPYLNYPYTNTGINQFNSPMQAAAPQMPMSTQSMMPPSAPPQTLGLNGKIVDSEDVVKATEVPIGGYNIKLDMYHEEMIADLIASHGEEILYNTQEYFDKKKWGFL